MSRYPLTGPFTSGVGPGLDAPFLNNIEQYLEYGADSNITTDGSGNLTTTGHFIEPNNTAFQCKDSTGAVHDTLYVDAANATDLQAAGSLVNVKKSDGTTIAKFDGNGPGVSYASSNGFTIGEGLSGPTNGFIIGRISGQAASIIACLGTGGGIGFKKGGMSGTRLAEFKNDGNMIIDNNTYWTHQSTFNFSASGAYDGSFDLAESSPVDQEYPHGTIVCPQENGLLSRCTHDACDYCMIVSLHPAFCAGGGRFDNEEASPDEQLSQPVALCGRVAVYCDEPIPFKRHVCSAGNGKVRPVRPGETVYSLGFALTASQDGRVLIFIR